MKTLKFLTILFFTSLLFTACSSDDDAAQQTPPVNEEEVITTLNVTLTPTTGTTPTITLQYQDLDGDGANLPEINVSGNLAAGITYTGDIELLNETETPAEDITEEVEVEEPDEHQFFYTIGTGLDATAAATNLDNNGNLLGTEFTLVSGVASTGNLTFTLRHEPTKPNTGLNDAGGETDLEVTFAVTIE